MSDAPKWDGVPTEEELRVMFRDPRYWRTRDPAFVKRVTDGFKALAKSQEARPAHTPSEVAPLTSAAWQAGWVAGRQAALTAVRAEQSEWREEGHPVQANACDYTVIAIASLPVPPPPHGEVG